MSLENALIQRSNSKCELCSSNTNLSAYEVHPNSGISPETSALVCSQCHDHINSPTSIDIKYWYPLKESMWSDVPAVQVLVYRTLKNLGEDPWAQDLLGQMYLDETTQKWADAAPVNDQSDSTTVVDSNGNVLMAGDTVTLIKDLVVKGANFTAKRGTTVKNISLTDDPKYIEGRINGTRIVLVAAYLKKA